MPLGPGIRYRVVKRGGKRIRLAFRGNDVVETKDLDTGETSMPDRKRRDESPDAADARGKRGQVQELALRKRLAKSLTEDARRTP